MARDGRWVGEKLGDGANMIEIHCRKLSERNKNEINKSGSQLLLLLACYPNAGSIFDPHDSVISPEGGD